MNRKVIIIIVIILLLGLILYSLLSNDNSIKENEVSICSYVHDNMSSEHPYKCKSLRGINNVNKVKKMINNMKLDADSSFEIEPGYEISITGPYCKTDECVYEYSDFIMCDSDIKICSLNSEKYYSTEEFNDIWITI